MTNFKVIDLERCFSTPSPQRFILVRK